MVSDIIAVIFAYFAQYDIGTYDLLGIAGGVIAELLMWYQKRHKLKTAIAGIESVWGYVIVTLAMILLGGAAVHFYVMQIHNFTPVLALNVGGSTPLILRNLFDGKTPDLDN